MRYAVPALALVVAIAAAQAPGWGQRFNFSLLLNEGLYSANWTGEEKTSGSITAAVNHAAQKQFTRQFRFEHGIALAFGQQVTDEGEAWRWSKSEDKIRLDEVARFTLGIWVDPFVSAALKSQFIDRRDTLRTRLVHPLEFLEAAGVGRTFFESEQRMLKSQVGAAARQLLDELDTLGTVADAGVTWSTDFRTRLGTPDAAYSSKLVLYKPLVAFGTGREVGTWPQLDWQHELGAKIGKFVTARAYVQLLYDEIVLDQVRFKQTLGLGLSYAWARGM